MKQIYQYGTEENRAFLASQADALINFARRFPSPGGSSWYLGADGTPMREKSRETWITSRMAHSYILGAALGKEGCTELADAALRGLQGELCDKRNGGWYAGLKPDGSHLPDKQCYAHAFVILAACSCLEYGRPGARDLLSMALEIYEEFFWDEAEGLARDTWNTSFTSCDPYRGLNANMHSVEAFLAVADVTQKEEYRKRAGRIISRVTGWARENDWRIPEHFTPDWHPDLSCNIEKPDDQFKPYGATPGHGIEWARLITQWACSTYPQQEAGSEEAEGSREGIRKESPAEAIHPDAAQKPLPGKAACLDAAQKLYRRAVTDAWNADGAPGLVYTTDWDGTPVVHDRMHWTLAEAINTSAVLYQVTGNRDYADDYAQFMHYLDECVIDHKHGSWFHQLDRNNQVIGTVWPGKPDIYHALQAMLIPCSPADLSIAVALKAQARPVL